MRDNYWTSHLNYHISREQWFKTYIILSSDDLHALKSPRQIEQPETVSAEIIKYCPESPYMSYLQL